MKQSTQVKLQTQQLTPMHVFRESPTGVPIYIGDFPPPWINEPVISPGLIMPIPPRDVEYVPSWMRPYERSYVSSRTETHDTPWRVNHQSDKVIATIDVPGVKESDLIVDIENGIINVSGRRFDTSRLISHSQVIGNQYDSSTAEATLDCGVLTVIVKRFKEKMSRRIQINKK